jgi:hypothetical protein
MGDKRVKVYFDVNLSGNYSREVEISAEQYAWWASLPDRGLAEYLFDLINWDDAQIEIESIDDFCIIKAAEDSDE